MARKAPAESDAGTKTAPNRWSQRVTRESNALDLEPGVFTMEPKEMAESLKRSAEASNRRKTTPFRSAMSMLVFYQNRAGRSLSAKARKNIELAKDELRRLYGKPTQSGR
jgi:hypothetical protein